MSWMEVNSQLPPMFKINEDHYLVEFGRPVRKFSSAPFNGGYGFCSIYLNRTVPKDYCKDPVADSVSYLNDLGLDADSVCLTMTACDTRKLATGVIKIGSYCAHAWITAGVSNALSIGSRGFSSPGTVNIAVAVDFPLTDSGAVNLLQSIVESKAQAFNDMEIRDVASGHLAPGTSTDTVSLFILTEDQKLNYGGRLTDVGFETSKLVYGLVGEAIRRCTA